MLGNLQDLKKNLRHAKFLENLKKLLSKRRPLKISEKSADLGFFMKNPSL